MKLTKKIKITYFLKVKNKISQLKIKETKIINFLKLRDKMSQLKIKGLTSQILKNRILKYVKFIFHLCTLMYFSFSSLQFFSSFLSL